MKNPDYVKGLELFSDAEQTILLREGHCGEAEIENVLSQEELEKFYSMVH